MKIKLLEYEAEVEWISPRRAYLFPFFFLIYYLHFTDWHICPSAILYHANYTDFSS